MQAALSRLESQEKIDDETLDKIAKELSTSVETFKIFDGKTCLAFRPISYGSRLLPYGVQIENLQ
ncbi:hypothetical protein FACS1894123_01740 [Bacteroidia bacterium]|nr:hypothetical protein FACS1894123_01740 [Bacteroidia bacterium]